MRRFGTVCWLTNSCTLKLISEFRILSVQGAMESTVQNAGKRHVKSVVARHVDGRVKSAAQSAVKTQMKRHVKRHVKSTVTSTVAVLAK